VVVTFTLLFGAAVAISDFTSAEILLSEATGSAAAGAAGGFAAVAVSGAAGAGAAGAGAAGASLAGAAGGVTLLLATLLALSELAGLALVFAFESLLVSESASLARFRAARRSAAAFFLDALAWSEGAVASFCATLGVGAVTGGGAARAAALATAASSTGAEAGAAGAAVVASGGAGAAAGATGAAGVILATCIACSLRDTYIYNPPPKSAARATPTTILGAGEGVVVEFIVSTRSLQVTLMLYIRRFVTPVSALELCASPSPTSAALPAAIRLISKQFYF
jgi:hypothetical protein